MSAECPEGPSCSLGLWPEDLCKGLLSGGSTAASTSFVETCGDEGLNIPKARTPPTTHLFSPTMGSKLLLAVSTGSPPVHGTG